MKKTIKSIMAMLALSSLLFASCGKDGGDQPADSESTVSMNLNGGTFAKKSLLVNL
jgi:predicted small lipoprotein YifL